LTDRVAVLRLTHVNYLDGRLHAMAQIHRAAHVAGALVVWDPADRFSCRAGTRRRHVARGRGAGRPSGIAAQVAGADGAWAITQVLLACQVVGGFRAPDVLRFGFTPAYARYADVWDAVEHLRQVQDSGEWREARFGERAAVTLCEAPRLVRPAFLCPIKRSISMGGDNHRSVDVRHLPCPFPAGTNICRND
jgi:hypothetical protein